MSEKSATERLRGLLDERGIEWRSPPHYSSESEDNETIFKVNGFEWYANDHGNGYLALRTCKLLVTPEQAIAATVGDKPKDNPRNYKPNGEPKIPNMNIGADPDWVDWVASLENKEPSNLTEAVKQFMFEVICFGGDMGPNGNVCEGIDEGMVLTNDFIDGWAKRIAATVGAGTCRDCKYAHKTVGQMHSKWCDHPYFDPDFFCGNFERREEVSK